MAPESCTFIKAKTKYMMHYHSIDNLLPGDRVIYSLKGLDSFPNSINCDRIATVTSFSRKNYGCVNVRWDGTKYTENYHTSFLTRVKEK